jgi:7-cyano-7-deazaguanine synthase
VKRGVVLLSGGLDSATVLALAVADGFTCSALSFRYGQRHAVELRAAERVARAFSVEHRVVDVDLRGLQGEKASALLGGVDVPKEGGRSPPAVDEIPVTYVPARNTLFLAFALGLAEVTGARDLFIGANAVDYSGYPDCRPEFIAAFEGLANLATKAGVEAAAAGARGFAVHAPLVAMTKADIIRAGTKLGLDYGLTWSCYDPQQSAGDDVVACGACDSCRIRRQGFLDAGVADPTKYR